MDSDLDSDSKTLSLSLAVLHRLLEGTGRWLDRRLCVQCEFNTVLNSVPNCVCVDSTAPHKQRGGGLHGTPCVRE